MSAIAGIYYLDNRPVDLTDLTRMTDILAHRGSDGVNKWSDRFIGFGHRMLWTTPESLLEKLPFHKETSQLTITADARIDNRDDLIAKLELTHLPPEKITDSQIILAAYEKWGEDCPKELLGDFAFAIWDGSKHQLFCARDCFGIKPFYYYHSAQQFAFATEIKALLCLPEIPSNINELMVADHLSSICPDPTITFYEGIVRLLPAHTLTITQVGSTSKCYWKLDPSRELRLGSNQEYAQAFREIFTEAVRCRLRTAFPLGSMLSGGLDSSSVSCTARKILDNSAPLHTFSAVFDHITQCDERPYQDSVLAQGGFEPYRLAVDEISPLVEIQQVHRQEEGALLGGNHYILWCLQKGARERAIRVLLSGFDGDTVVSHGTGYLRELAENRQWVKLAKEVIQFSRKSNQPWKGALWSWVVEYGIKPLVSKYPILRRGRNFRRALTGKVLSQKLNRTVNISGLSTSLNDRFVKELNLKERFKTHYQNNQAFPKTEREDHYFKFHGDYFVHTFESMDKAAAIFGMELRFPFWDKRLVEFCLSLPPEQKLENGWSRLVMRRGMENILPPKVQWRKGKINFTNSFNQGLLTFERELLDDLFFNQLHLIEKYVDVKTVQDAYVKFVNQKATSNESVILWRVISLALWLQDTTLNKSDIPQIKGGDLICSK
ncbi:lasso peptide isopeptide bond-forming cyclase [Merismopedia glauca]|uniref:asparagine synthase (glutamine-hydrolyzing) n=1 Tax=Merismopedia glauca CCAP 1448/3 TaxID=1296344 RepID=A0A2T1C1X4_9CYAN|nr:lasso peptide isopeptide bond-forming cyclase [Merismopedia glauca]PSB02276.1 asparagine synthase (glutamine-hydrolyzing) [Merismopedia glauca CCAP 1448/3]